MAGFSLAAGALITGETGAGLDSEYAVLPHTFEVLQHND